MKNKILIFILIFGGAYSWALPLHDNKINEENFHSSLYIDDPRVTQIEGHMKLLDGFSRKLFKRSNTCFELDKFVGTQQSNIQLEFKQKVVGTNIFNPFFSKYYNNVYNSHVDDILNKQNQQTQSAFQIAVHKTTFARERDTDYVKIQDRYGALLLAGDFFTFGELCASGYVSSFDKYAGAWFTLVFNRDADGNDAGFISLVETYIRLFDSTIEPKIRAQLNRELANRAVTLYAEFRGMNPLTIPIQNLRDIEQFRKLITQIKSAMLSSDSGLYMALEYTPWGYNYEFQNYFYDFLKRNTKLPTEPGRRQWFNFYQNIELARLMGDAFATEADYVDRFEVCRKQMLRDYPLNRQNEKQLFVNHLNPKGPGVPLSQIHQLLSEETLNQLKEKLKNLESSSDGSIATCHKRLIGQTFYTNHYQDFKECIWFDEFTKTPTLIVDALCPLTPK
ncbi:hypothetical protein DAY19_03180 [Halobacteriovorax vibrionivorans]|uniref:Uncharacterized protein n=1 Tax=Halobacteriovorax vibrionivorans TaxID=2152716 RepID=A0ABY0IJY0_9BACT|nr:MULTISPECIES: hypothetical protein [Halobacteriovorax]RZF22790.1 hypothetical protein DAY19_03180 [Halobacteriovorax vibrionivorans]TGD45981.1 hypothetical protein EP118_13870 [Halobacteriovorax sp. Y22]